MFRELGLPAAFVYEALEHASAPVRSFDLTTVTGLSRSAVYDALETLAAFNLVNVRDGRWTINKTASLDQLAEQFGCLEMIRVLVHRHRQERITYRRALRIVDHHDLIETLVAPEDAEPYLWQPEPPPEEQSLLDLLERELGAHPVPATAW